MKVYAQNELTFSLIGSYQFHEQQAISLGFGTTKKVDWPKVNFDQYIKTMIRGSIFLTGQEGENIYSGRWTTYWTSDYGGIGMDGRIFIFQGSIPRLDLGPSIKIGYRSFWLEYSANFLIADFPFHDADPSPIAFKGLEHNLNLTLTIVIKRKE